MRSFYISMLLSGAVLGVVGCPKNGPQTPGDEETIASPNAVDPNVFEPNAAEPNAAEPNMVVTVDGELPDYAAGRWVSRETGWEFIIAEDGRITYTRMSMGRVWVKPGKTTMVPMKGGGRGFFQPGTWHLHFDKPSRVLTIGITLRNLAVDVPNNRIKGSSRDTFVGPISDDNRTWETTWTSFPKYWAYTDEHPEGVYLGVDDPVYGNEQQVVFEKVAIDGGAGGSASGDAEGSNQAISEQAARETVGNGSSE